MVDIQEFLYLYWLVLSLDLKVHRAFLLDLGSDLPTLVTNFLSRRSFEVCLVNFRQLVTFEHLYQLTFASFFFLKLDTISPDL